MKDVKKDIVDYLRRSGRASPSEIANGIGYSTGYVRGEAKELRKNGTINGNKSRQIPFYDFGSDIEVISSNRDHLLKLVEKYAPAHLAAAKSMSVKDLQRFLRNISNGVVGVQKGWEFWT